MLTVDCSCWKHYTTWLPHPGLKNWKYRPFRSYPRHQVLSLTEDYFCHIEHFQFHRETTKADSKNDYFEAVVLFSYFEAKLDILSDIVVDWAWREGWEFPMTPISDFLEDSLILCWVVRNNWAVSRKLSNLRNKLGFFWSRYIFLVHEFIIILHTNRIRSFINHW